MTPHATSRHRTVAVGLRRFALQESALALRRPVFAPDGHGHFETRAGR